ncbi:hypothetical protein [Desulfurispora thermophila]|uniref:hypothetical protein n=1 Tax=Desulfurispora thermophila TaxID=265470 RepID=UPI0003A3713C|nr:hypothetical protein [Desulfurispora thermophila]
MTATEIQILVRRIEKFLVSQPGVGDAVVVHEVTPEGDNCFKALVEPDNEPLPAGLRYNLASSCQQVLSLSYPLFIKYGLIPRTPSGKVARHLLAL